MEDDAVDYPAARGIHTAEDGERLAAKALEHLLGALQDTGQAGMDLTLGTFAMWNFMTRAQGFHEAAADAIRSDNPFAAFTLLRAYAENAAALIWLHRFPERLDAFVMTAEREDRVSVGKLTNEAKRQYPTFGLLYEQLSSYAHPTHAGGLSGSSDVTDDGQFTWRSRGRFRSDEERRLAWLWIVELAEVTRDRWEPLMRALTATVPPSPAP